MKKFILIALTAVFLIGIYLLVYPVSSNKKTIVTYADCIKAKDSTITLSYPSTCATRDGKRFTEPLEEDADDKLQPPKKSGQLIARVFFTGLSCKPGTGNTPPCDGLYPGYDFRIYDNNGEKIVATTKTDQNGIAKINLPEGDYKWIQNEKGIMEKQAVDFEIKADETTQTDFYIDTGMR